MTHNLLRPLGIGEILDGAFMFYRRHFAVLLGTAFIAFLPTALLSAQLALLGEPFDPEVPSAGAVITLVLVILASTIGMLIAWGALTRQLARAYAGEPVTLRDGLTHGLRALIPLTISVLLAYIGMVAIIMVPGIFLAIFIPAMAALGGGIIVTGVVGGMVVLGVLFATPAFLASLFALVPAIVIERQGPWGALRRSWQLARGGRLRIIGVLFICWLIAMLPMMAVMVLVGAGTAFFNPAAAEQVGGLQLFFQNTVGSLVGALTVPCLAGCMVLLYYDRRIRLEGYDLEAAADALAAVE